MCLNPAFIEKNPLIFFFEYGAGDCQKWADFDYHSRTIHLKIPRKDAGGILLLLKIRYSKPISKKEASHAERNQTLGLVFRFFADFS